MPSYDFLTLDVFTRRPFGGNPLAVFPDARGLDSASMQAIATEFNLSETVFMLPPPDGSEAIATVRIFTPVNELPFAGHPNVGASFHVASEGGIFGRECGDRFVFDELAGPVECTVDRSAGVETAIAAPQPLSVIEAIDPALVADCASLPLDAIAVHGHAPSLASVGLPFCLAEVGSLDVLGEARPNPAAFREANARHPRAEDHFNLYLYCRSSDDPSSVRTRMFAPLVGVAEDPATGSAGAALAAFLATLDGPDDDRRYAITQGVEMGRRSDMVATVSGGRARIGGPCVAMQKGTLTL
jgi:trans-2,3-dihydro-3-hydroxyanthranilate isomerase